jgi:hypothetical protein
MTCSTCSTRTALPNTSWCIRCWQAWWQSVVAKQRAV